MKKNSQKHKKRSTAHPVQTSKELSSIDQSSLLDILAERRTGGAESIKGFVFQCTYSVWKMLSYLAPGDYKEDRFVRLEGIEDIDVGKVSISNKNTIEFIQIKASINKIDAGMFWERKVLQNFAEVYLTNPQSRFRFVHTKPLAEGILTRLANASSGQKQLLPSDLWHWQEKFDGLKSQNPIQDWSSFDLPDFLSRITFEITNESSLITETKRLLIANYGVSTGNEEQYRNALNWLALLWSRDRRIIRYQDVAQLIEFVRTEIAKGTVNLAVKDKWLTSVLFDIKKHDEAVDYFEGKAARPYHIAAGLPARRNKWEETLLKAFRDSDITVIRASGGQGKSTLAWQLTSALLEQGWTIYELNRCKNETGIGDLISFIESRLKIGELPVIVIDGLRETVSDWAELAERLRELPVKFIVTTREEDWYRFGADRSQLRLIPISIKMDREEAESIFKQFKQANKIHPKITGWQSAWERVEERGLLIEYIYLLTQGEMIEDRLAHQVRLLADERDSAAKLEILRLVSVADLCGIQLPASSLINSVQNRIGFVGDRGETLKSLKSEYYIQIENRTVVEGLHPVRSEHLARLLHETISLTDTLINLLPLIDNNSLAQFSSQAPLLIQNEERLLLIESLAKHSSERPYFEINKIIDGLFSAEVINHWNLNKPIYDEMFERGVSLFAIEAFPWSGVNILQEFIDVLDGNMKSAFVALSELVKKIIPFKPDESDTLRFVKSLSQYLKDVKSNTDLRGLGRLAKWFIRFEQICPPFTVLDEERIWHAFKMLESDDAGELFTACYLLRRDMYQSIWDRHKGKIIGELKRRTKTLTIQGEGERLQIEYLLYEDAPPHEQSINRINVIKRFLPQYETYSTQGLWPPLPILEYSKKTVDDSFKQISAKNLYDDFQINLNRIWLDRLSSLYDSPSIYEWQKQWYNIRAKSIDTVMTVVRFFESLLQGDGGRSGSAGARIDAIRPEIRHLILSKKEFPQRNSKYIGKSEFKNEIAALTGWTTSWTNFLDQLEQVIKPNKDNARHIANVNAQETLHKLEDMQNAYDFIAQKTFPYFDVTDLKEKEKTWFDRLSKIIAFYISVPESIGKTPFPKESAATWWAKKEKDRIGKIKEVLVEYAKESGYECIVPTRTIEDGIVRKAVIGLRGLPGKDLDKESPRLIFWLSELADIDIHQFLVVIVKGNHPEGPYAISFGNDYLKMARDSMESGKEFEEPSYSRPHPVLIDKDMLAVLPGISLAHYEDDKTALAVTEILIDLWRLSESHKRLSSEEKVEYDWLLDLQSNYISNLKRNFAVLQKEGKEDLVRKYDDLMSKIVLKNAVLEEDEFNRLYGEDVQNVTS